ncbi:hypothetical protein CEE45_05545 [Candidatus Heimdallarchaeota archaeon B3_Heim]|nr:MAG: hypothetical protein CEE45_05545 [Candidatus Heimdallarchaeota archaeon B3_Heim]
MSKYICSNCGSTGGSEDLFCQECGSKYSSHKYSTYNDPKSHASEYRGYIQVVGIVEVIFGVFALLIAGILGLIAALMSMFFSDQTMVSMPDLFKGMSSVPAGSLENSYGIFLFIMLVLGFVAIFILIYGVLAIINGRRLMNYQKNGHSGSILISVLSLLAMPMGTIFGIFSLYVLTRPEVDQILS